MPQLIALALVGAGLYAGYKWLSKVVRRHGQAAARAQEEALRGAAEAAMGPKDLGSLVWDEQAGVYRPSQP